MILYSILVHECPECVEQMCKGILFFDNNSLIVIHASTSIDKNQLFSNDKIIINPIQYETRWGWDFAKIHISNYEYIINNFYFDISYVIFLTSNTLMIKNPWEFIKDYDAGFSEYNTSNNYKLTPPLLKNEYQISWGGSFLKSKEYINILSELNTDKMYGCIIDASYVNKFIMDKICYFYHKYFSNNEILKYINAPEEIIFPTISCNLTNKISESLIYLTNEIELNDLENINNYKNIYFIKRVSRDMNHQIRKYYNTLINKKYLDFFDAVYYINLDSRIDRRELFEKRIKELDIPAIRFSGIVPEEGNYRRLPDEQPRRHFHIGCTLSHQALIKNAKDMNYKNILIFEDDCLFLDNFKEKAQIYANELKTIEKWDLFYFGGDPTTTGKFITEHLWKIDGGVYQTHAYAVNNSAYDKILSIDANTIQSIDTSFAQSDNSFNMILGKDLLVIQDESFSDLWGSINISQKLIIDVWKDRVENSKKK